MKNETIYIDDEGLIWLNKTYANSDVYNAVAYDDDELTLLKKKNVFIPLSECHDLIKEIYDTIAYGDNGMWFHNDYQECYDDEAVSECEALHILIETLKHTNAYETGVFDDGDGLTVYSAFINYFIDDREVK